MIPLKIKHRGNQKGISLVEIMIALFLLGIGLLGVAGLQTTGIQRSSSAKWESAAITLAEEKMEALRGQGYFNLTLTGGWTTAESVSLTGMGSFSRQHNVSQAVTDKVKKVEVKVSWTDLSAATKQVNLSSYLER